MTCSIKHGFSDSRCIRKRGQAGRCWSRWYRGHQPKYLTRTEWLSRDGAFHMHYGYVERYVGVVSPSQEAGTPLSDRGLSDDCEGHESAWRAGYDEGYAAGLWDAQSETGTEGDTK